MNVRDLKARVLPVLLAGTRREPLPGMAELRPDAPLDAFSLVGQVLRFEMPQAPPHFDVDTWPHDERRLVPARVRPQILRLLKMNRCTDDTELAVALAFARNRLRAHPFDLPQMDGFVRRHNEYLGVIAQFWAQRDTRAESRKGYFDDDAISAENWTEAPIGARVVYLQHLRKENAGGAREALEKVWAVESADVRVRLIGAMEAGLSDADRAFLDAAAKDRAPRVRAVAHRLLARLSGSAANNPALAACLERIQKEKAGLLKRRIALKLELPANVKDPAAPRWIREQFQDVTLEELASSLEIPIAQLAGAAKDDSNLLFALAVVATLDKRLDLVAEIAKELPDAWGRMSMAGLDELSFTDDDQRARWVEAIVRPRDWMPATALGEWGWLLRRLQGPLTESVMQGVLKSQWWADQFSGEKKPGTEAIQVFCASCPAGMRGKLREQIDELDVDGKEPGLTLLDTLDTLDKLEAMR
jgi:hypothetical protein